MRNLFQFTDENQTILLARIKKLLSVAHVREKETMASTVNNFLRRKKQFLNFAKLYPTPFYILDSIGLEQSIDAFYTTFNQNIPGIKTYYAVKTNHHPFILNALVKKGWGLDISSVREFELGKEAGCDDFLFTGPGKTSSDLLYVLEKDPAIVIQIDSFGELERLGKITKRMKLKVKAGVRIYISAHKVWSKFGIPLSDLNLFWQQAKKYPYIILQGIQFHLSGNESTLPYQNAIKELSLYLKNHFNKEELSTIQFIDFGGGFLPYKSEGIYPWMTPQGNVIKTTNDYFDITTRFNEPYHLNPSIPIDEYAKAIGAAINTYLKPILSCYYFTEPGRIICNSAMHILLKVVDVKNEHNVIMDGGINIVGWERFEYEYFPVINLTHSSLEEHKCTLYGSLCMPDDLWGYYYFGSSIEEGDYCLVPNQGCLTYSLAQNFIRSIPDVYIL